MVLCNKQFVLRIWVCYQVPIGCVPCGLITPSYQIRVSFAILSLNGTWVKIGDHPFVFDVSEVR